MVREDDLRATFSALHGEEAPPRAVTAADLIQRGQAVRSRRRTIAVAGSGLATVGVVAVALAVLPSTTPPEPATPPVPSSTTTQVPATTPSSVPVEPTPAAPPGSHAPQTPPVQTTVPGSTTPPGPTTKPGAPSTSVSPTSSSTLYSVPQTSR
ncbi:hypothetical protein GCM10011609_87240 [Lentzea pudingi]|uniref:Uncharacterized protein n=1 Tax=Lentzea pudingi TaxID=1789439 RepID=A0ABQ2IXS7_9PSEU|nr:hypothetical protein [Lentzea pudingi]GGN29883.1 hypothetical protein GCM10011609_87240 [Lentzea pudingi]